MRSFILFLLLVLLLVQSVNSLAPPPALIHVRSSSIHSTAKYGRHTAFSAAASAAAAVSSSTQLHMSEPETSTTSDIEDGDDDGDEDDLMPMDAGDRIAVEKQRRADELRSQEVFMQRSTGIHRCSNCGFEYDETKGDSFLIGGTVPPGTPFTDLKSDWRCPTCRASKDSFVEVTEEIPGFAVNQGYGIGTNAMTSGQKNLLIWGSLGAFFLLFMSGYALS